MTGLVRKATLITACGLLVAAVSMASVPSPCNSTLPCGISLVGSASGAADPLGTFTVTVKDLANNPVANSSVVVDFSGCCADIRPSRTQLGAGLTPDPATNTVRAISNASGVATFTIMGGATAAGVTPNGGCVKIYADGVLMNDGTCHPATTQVAVYDENGALLGGAGVGPADLSIWLADFFAALNVDRSDYDFNVLCAKNVGPADLSKWLALFFAANSTGNGATYFSCPPAP